MDLGLFKLPNRRIPPRGWIAYGHDILMAGLSFPLALYLRLGDDIWAQPADIMLIAGMFFTATAAAVFYVAGLYRGVWRYASINDLLSITKAVSLAVLIFLLAMFIWVRLEDFADRFAGRAAVRVSHSQGPVRVVAVSGRRRRTHSRAAGRSRG